MATKRTESTPGKKPAARQRGPKRIAVGDGYELVFDQRARGQESPFWVGRVFKDGVEVGEFNNEGTGGMTFIHPVEVERAFEKLVLAHVPPGSERPTHREGAGWIVYFAEMKGYTKALAALTLAEFVEQWSKDV
jgi:hypothetical protein